LETLKELAISRNNSLVIEDIGEFIACKQLVCGDHDAQSTAKKRTRPEEFLSDMEDVMPLLDLIG